MLDNREMQIKGKVESKEKIIRFISENYQITTNQLGVGPDKGGHWEVIKK